MVAGILAYLIPGAGHFYQGRTTKGLIYCLSILGLFLWGQKLGEGMVVYGEINLNPPRITPLSYVAQLGVGSLALPAAYQNQRAKLPANHTVRRLNAPFSAPFEGMLNPGDNGEPGVLIGTVRLEPSEGQFGPEVRGTFDGTLNGKPTKLELGGSKFELDRPVKAGLHRALECSVIDGESDSLKPRMIIGSVPRSWFNSYGVTPDPGQLQDVNDRLGKLYELAVVFTLIAGLLNFLAIWDCVNGPAYGFGDEHSSATMAKSSMPEMGSLPPAGAKSEPPRAEPRSNPKSPV